MEVEQESHCYSSGAVARPDSRYELQGNLVLVLVVGSCRNCSFEAMSELRNIRRDAIGRSYCTLRPALELRDMAHRVRLVQFDVLRLAGLRLEHEHTNYMVNL